MPSKATSQPTPSDDAIRTRAYLMWEADGQPWGRDEHYWNRARTELAALVPSRPKRAEAVAPVTGKVKKAPAGKSVKAAAKGVKSAAAKAPKAPRKAKTPKL